MDERPPNLRPESGFCEQHRVRHGPSGCPLCRRGPEPAVVVGLPFEDRSLSGFALVTDFVRNRGPLTLGLLLAGLLLMRFLPGPLPVMTGPADAYRTQIMQLEAALFFEGASDRDRDPATLDVLFDALLTEFRRRQPEARPEYTIEALEKILKRLRSTPREQFNLIRPRENWTALRDEVFVGAPWFRHARPDLTQVQARIQGEEVEAPEDTRRLALAALDAYETALERHAARAGALADRLCSADAVQAVEVRRELGELVSYTEEALDAVPRPADPAHREVAEIHSGARGLSWDYLRPDCSQSASASAKLNGRVTSFRARVEELRARYLAMP